MQAELIAIGFSSPEGAFRMAKDLKPLQRDHLLQLEAATVVVKQSDGKLKFQTGQSIYRHTLWAGSAWGLLTGAVFFEPVLGLLVGTICGAFTGNLLERNGPITHELVKDVGQRKLEPGQSALLLLVKKATPDKVLRKLSHHDATIIQTSLSTEQERELRQNWQTLKQGPISQPKFEIVDRPALVPMTDLKLAR